jgi:myo-inositol-1(or 4)-monophosphatase
MFKDVGIAAARQAGQLMLDWRANLPPGPARMEYKSAKDVVTEVDTRAEALIIEIISQNFPDHNFMGEEGGNRTVSASPYTWVIDPLDGTANYAADLAASCVSIALMHRQELILGIVFNPFRDELFVAEKGMGAFLNDYQIRVGQEQNLAKALVCFDLGYNEEEAVKQLELATFFRPRVRSMRILGSAVLAICYVACSRYDLFCHRNLSEWDLAAGLLIAAEAGAIVTTGDGEPASIFKKSIVVANSSLHRQYFEVLKDFNHTGGFSKPY